MVDIWEHFNRPIILAASFVLVFLHTTYLADGLSVMLFCGIWLYITSAVFFDGTLRFSRSGTWSLSVEYIWILCGLFGAFLALSDYDIRFKHNLIKINQESYKEQLAFANDIIS